MGECLTTVITRMLAIGTLLSLKGDPSPSRYNVYTIKRSNTLELAKIGITRQNDPINRTQSQLSGLNVRHTSYGSHIWNFIQEPVSQESALLYEKYYVWEYFQHSGKMPYAQSYLYPDALTRYLEKFYI